MTQFKNVNNRIDVLDYLPNKPHSLELLGEIWFDSNLNQYIFQPEDVDFTVDMLKDIVNKLEQLN